MFNIYWAHSTSDALLLIRDNAACAVCLACLFAVARSTDLPRLAVGVFRALAVWMWLATVSSVLTAEPRGIRHLLGILPHMQHEFPGFIPDRTIVVICVLVSLTTFCSFFAGRESFKFLNKWTAAVVRRMESAHGW